MALISARSRREQADSIKRAADEEKYARTVEIADKVAERVREMVEEKIAEAAGEGKRSVRFVLGLDETSFGIRGLVADAYETATGESFGRFGWSYVLRNGGDKERSSYVHTLWERGVEVLLEDLEECGYEVEVVKSDPHARSENLEICPKYMVDNYTVISW